MGDMSTTSLSVADLKPLFDRLTEGTRALRHAKDRVPDEVIELVDSFAIELHTETPTALGADPDLVAELFGAAVRAQKALRQPTPEAQRRQLRLPLEQVQVLVAQIIEDAPYAADVPTGQVLHNLVTALNVPQRDIAELLGIAPRTLQRWLAAGATLPSGEEESRVRLVAQLVNQLRHSFTPTGVVAWFKRKHPWLDAAPIDLLSVPARHNELLLLARRSRFAP
jgi:hypothetical protein